MPELHRRTFLRSLGFIACAPAIVRASSIMPVKSWRETSIVHITGPIFDFASAQFFVRLQGQDEVSGEWTDIGPAYPAMGSGVSIPVPEDGFSRNFRVCAVIDPRPAETVRFT